MRTHSSSSSFPNPVFPFNALAVTPPYPSPLCSFSASHNHDAALLRSLTLPSESRETMSCEYTNDVMRLFMPAKRDRRAETRHGGAYRYAATRRFGGRPEARWVRHDHGSAHIWEMRVMSMSETEDGKCEGERGVRGRRGQPRRLQDCDRR